jgi:hypothetical protein
MEYSPLYPIRKILTVKRILFGFPLRSENEEFSKFSFSSSLEYTRCLIFVFLSSLGLVICISSNSENKQSQMTNSTRESLHFLDLQSHETFVIELYLVSNLFSCILYVKSYKSSRVGINNICQKLITIRGYITTGFLTNVTNSTCRFIHSSGYRRFLFAHCIAILSAASLVFNYLDNIPKDYSQIKKILVLVLSITLTYTCCYPGIASSTDLLIIHLLQQVERDFEKWAVVIRRVYYDEQSIYNFSHRPFVDPNIKIKYVTSVIN